MPSSLVSGLLFCPHCLPVLTCSLSIYKSISQISPRLLQTLLWLPPHSGQKPKSFQRLAEARTLCACSSPPSLRCSLVLSHTGLLPAPQVLWEHSASGPLCLLLPLLIRLIFHVTMECPPHFLQTLLRCYLPRGIFPSHPHENCSPYPCIS